MLDSKVLVIKYGGSLLEDPPHRAAFLKEIAALAEKSKVVLVHGGGKEITRALEQKGVPAHFVNGLRVTDASAMTVVEETLARVNQAVVRELTEYGARAEGYSGRTEHLLRAKIIPELGRVGKPDIVDFLAFGRILVRRGIPVFYSVGEDSEGKPLNINADDFALALALACSAARLVFLTDSGGILDKDGKQIQRLNAAGAEAMIRDGVITGGMIVKTRASIDALMKGVGAVDITKNMTYLLTGDEASSAVTRFIK